MDRPEALGELAWKERRERISRSLRERGVAKDGERYFTTQEFAEQAEEQKR